MQFDDIPETPQVGGAPPPPRFDMIPDTLAPQQPVAPPQVAGPPMSFDQLPEVENDQLPKSFDQLPLPQQVQEQVAPKTTPRAVEVDNTAVPGFWSTVGNAFTHGVVQRTLDDIAGTKVALPAGVGGSTLEQQFQQGLVAPETKGAIDELLAKKVNEGWSDPKWWGAQLAHGAGSTIPGLGAAGAGALVGGSPGAIVGFGLEGYMGTLVPAYKAARTAGLEPEDAVTRAIVDSGIASATAVAMGMAPTVSLFGRTTNIVNDQVATMLKRPVMEMLAQLGVVQPGLAVSGELIKDLTHGEVTEPWQLATTYIVGAAQGVPIVGAHGAMAGIRQMRRTAEVVEPPALPEQVQASFQNQEPPPTPNLRPEVGRPVEGFVSNEEGLEARPQPMVPVETSNFFSPVRRTIEEKMPASATAQEVSGILRGAPGVKAEEMNQLQLPAYLADPNGRVNKADLLAHIDANSVQVQEVRYGALNDFGNVEPLQFPADAYWLPGPDSNRREFVLKVPVDERLLDPSVIEQKAFDMWNYNFRQEFGPWSQAGENSRQEMRAKARKTLMENHPDIFTGSHWNDPNVFAHFRASDRVGRNGEVLFHIGEIQSDMHQLGREAGYLAPGEKRLDVAELEKTQAHWDRQIKKVEAAHRNNEDAFTQDPLWRDFVERWKEASKALEPAYAQRNKLAAFPFQTSWQELVVKRALQIAADEGYDGVSWSNGDQVGLRLKDERELAGARLNYDKKIPSLFNKWAKKIGMDITTTKLEGANMGEYLTRIPQHARAARAARLMAMGLNENGFNRENGVVLLNPSAGNRIRMGLPLYETPPEGKGSMTLKSAIQKGNPKELAKFIEPLTKFLGQLGNDMKISRPIEFKMGPMRSTWRGQAEMKDGVYRIKINTRILKNAADMYATAIHEVGHVIMWDKFGTAPQSIRMQIRKAFNDFRMQMTQQARDVGDVRRIRDNPISEMTGGRNLLMQDGRMSDTVPLSDLTPQSRAYILHFEEWFAEQVAKWGATSEKPLTRLEKFMKDVGTAIRKLVEKFRGTRATPAEAVPAMQQWLDSLVGDRGKFAADQFDQMDLDSKRRNADAVDKDGAPEFPATPAVTSTIGGRNILDALPPGLRGVGEATAAYADRMNRFYEWMISLPQIAELNKHIRPLQMYKEIVGTMNLEKNTIMSAAWERLRQWKGIRDPKQQVALGKFIEDYMNQDFKIVQDGLIRRPTQAEFTQLAAKHKLSAQSLALFDGLVRDFDGLLESYRALLVKDAERRIKDPVAQQEAINRVNERVQKLLERPYFPAMRFGKYTITVYDSVGNVRHFEQTDTLRKQRLIMEALNKHVNKLPGDKVVPGEVPKDATPLLGLPPGILDLMADKLSLSKTQRDMLDQLRFDYAPTQSFRHQFRQRDLTPGYSTDFQRAYANFFFHGANHITRVKWVDALRDQVHEVRASKLELPDNMAEKNKRDQIANYMTEHLQMLVDPKPDFAALRSLMFHWYLGFNPASATLNLSQTPLMTYPHLASKFGDAVAIKALSKAATDLNNFYKKGNLVEQAKNAPPGPEGAAMRALGEAVKEGVISETQAHELAAVSENRNLLRAFGSKGEELWHKFSESSSWMFEMAEQYNRRIAFRAAWELAMRDPNAKYVKDTVQDNLILYTKLREGDTGQAPMSHQEASAFVAAKDSVQKSQFVYAPYARPKFMWGRAGSLFIFKSFVQNTLFNLWSNPSMAARHLVILGALGGMMGLPGMEDINGIIKALGWHLFGKDFDVEDQARKFAVDVLNGAVSPDMLLHGTSVKGFGIPQVLNAMGAQVGMPKLFPTLDRHGSIGMGNILPFEPGKAFGPTKDVKSQGFTQLQRASGAGFSNLFSLYEVLNAQQGSTGLKDWEKVMPRAFSNISHSFRYLRDQQETNKAGNSVVKFDPTDTEHMAEILARALGYQPRRLTGAWEAIAAKTEQVTFWDLRQQLLLRQFGEAVKKGNPEDREMVIQAIKKYNSQLPPEARARAITGETLRNSVMNRMRTRAMQEAGLPLQKKNIEMFQQLDKYFPDGRPTGQVDARPVR